MRTYAKPGDMVFKQSDAGLGGTGLVINVLAVTGVDSGMAIVMWSDPSITHRNDRMYRVSDLCIVPGTRVTS